MNTLALGCLALIFLQPPATNRSSREIEERAQILPVGDAVFHRITQGPMQLNFIERGEIQPATQAEIVCKLRADDPSGKASTITWLIEDGSLVKKGEVLARLDDTRLKDSLQRLRHEYEQKKADLVKTMEDRSLTISRAEFDMEKAQLETQLAVLELQDAKDEQAKRRSDLKKHLAELALTRAKSELTSRKKRADAMLVPTQLAVQAATGRLGEIEAQLQQCQLLAPHDGLATYYLPESTRFNSSSMGIGESVKEGQKLMLVSELSKYQVVCKIHESIITKVKPGMKAIITVASNTTNASVSQVSPIISSTDWMSADTKVYPVRLAFDSAELNDQLRPGMSCRINLKLAERDSAILVPIQAVREQRGLRYCFVKTSNGIERRAIKTGISNTQTMEVLSGLKPGEEVVMNPPRAIETKEPARPIIPGPKPQGAIHLKSIHPITSNRSFIERYGLTEDDLEFVKSLSPDVIAPIRLSSAEVLNTTGTCLSISNMLATSSELAEFYPSLTSTLEGRFLCECDNTENARVTVIGKTLADKLYPLGNAVGETLRISSKNTLWTIVGILAEQPEELAQFNDGVFVPWNVMRTYHGEVVVVRSRGMRGAEVVPYSHILLRLAAGQSVTQTARIIRSRLEVTHAIEDWGVITSSSR